MTNSFIPTLTAVLFLGLLAPFPATPAGSETGGSLSSQYITLSIQGDLREAGELFRRFEPLSEAEISLKQEFESRFRKNPFQNVQTAVSNNLAEQLSNAYRNYWRQGLLGNRDSREIGKLFSAEQLDQEGLYHLETMTPPYRDLFIWREQTSARYRVQLTDVSTTVTVNFMDDFIVQGWKEFASLGLASTTGWVENGELYCVAWAYDAASENFAVSYLKHEARHLVDLREYPDMRPVELEYRAKLTELAYAHSSLKRILDDFRVKAVENPDSAHAMANWRVIRDIYRDLEGGDIPADWAGWGYPDVGQVNRAARKLLEENTRINRL